MENKIEKANEMWLMLVWISEMSSNIAFISMLMTTALLAIALEIFPAHI